MTPRTLFARRFAPASEILAEATDRIRRSPAIDHWRASMAREDAEELLTMASHLDDPKDVDLEAALPPATLRRYSKAIRRRVAGEPVALIRGHIVFAGLELRVRPGVFVPRGSSELLADTAIAALRGRRKPVAVDVACGAGPVACAVAAAVPRAEVWGVDVSREAVALARSNARRNRIGNARFGVSNLLRGLPDALGGRVALFTIHPPYVARGDVRGLPREIRAFEPRHTLSDGSEDGLGLVRDLSVAAPQFLVPDGQVIVEVAPYLSRRVQGILRRASYAVDWVSDPEGVTRVVSGHRRG